MPETSKVRCGAVLAALVLVLVGCDGGESNDGNAAEGPKTGVVTITMTDDSCEYEGPESVSDGHLTIEFVKETDASGEIRLLRIADGVTFDDLSARIDEDQDRLDRDFQAVGYESLASEELWVPVEVLSKRQHVHSPFPEDLEPGEHAFLCRQFSGESASALGLAGPLELIP